MKTRLIILGAAIAAAITIVQVGAAASPALPSPAGTTAQTLTTPPAGKPTKARVANGKALKITKAFGQKFLQGKSARGQKAKRKNLGLVIGETESILRSCSGRYIADWGGEEFACGWDRYYQQVFVSQIVTFYYLDVGADCWRQYKFWIRGYHEMTLGRGWTEHYLDEWNCV
jgi:hypothetical protein